LIDAYESDHYYSFQGNDQDDSFQTDEDTVPITSLGPTDILQKICNGFPCTIIAFRADLLKVSLNPLNLQYKLFINGNSKGNGAVYPCHNTIFQPNVMRSVIATAPTALVQQYKVCQYSMQAAMTQAIGIASGSAALYQ